MFYFKFQLAVEQKIIHLPPLLRMPCGGPGVCTPEPVRVITGALHSPDLPVTLLAILVPVLSVGTLTITMGLVTDIGVRPALNQVPAFG